MIDQFGDDVDGQGTVQSMDGMDQGVFRMTWIQAILASIGTVTFISLMIWVIHKMTEEARTL